MSGAVGSMSIGQASGEGEGEVGFFGTQLAGIISFCEEILQVLAAEYPVITCIILMIAGIGISLTVWDWVQSVFARRIRLVTASAMKTYGDWAVITGATDGIGKGIAIELAKLDVKLVLIGRSESKLAQTEMDITQALKGQQCEMRSIVVDFSVVSDLGYRAIWEGIKDLDIGVLINNVGVSYPHPLYYEEMAPEALDTMVNVNVRSMMRMTRMVLPGMKERGRGAILMLGSAGAELPSWPMYAGYCATKAAADGFAKSLQAEVSECNVFVQTQTPLMVATKMSKIRRGSFFVASVSRYAQAALSALVSAGSNGKDAVVCPLFAHRLQLAIAHALPSWLYQRYILQHNQGIRKSALARKAKQAAEKKAE